jgi:hypothetical protein
MYKPEAVRFVVVFSSSVVPALPVHIPCPTIPLTIADGLKHFLNRLASFLGCVIEIRPQLLCVHSFRSHSFKPLFSVSVLCAVLTID